MVADGATADTVFQDIQEHASKLHKLNTKATRVGIELYQVLSNSMFRGPSRVSPDPSTAHPVARC